MNLIENAVLAPVEQHKEAVPFVGHHRVIAIDPENDLISLFRLTEPLGEPFVENLSTMQSLLDEGKIREGRIQLSGYMLRDEFELKEGEKATVEERYKFVRIYDQLDAKLWAFSPRIRSKILQKVATELGVCRRTAQRWRNHYLRFGRSPASLLPATSRCGAPGKERRIGEAKRGRRRNAVKTADDPENTGINITPELRQIFSSYYDLYYAKQEKRPLGYVYRRIIEHFFSTEVMTPEGEKNLVQTKLSPSYGQFKYWIFKEIDLLKAKKKREGEVRWNLRHRALAGKVAESVFGPGDCFELDSTILDLYAVSAIRRSWLIGRPILYFVTDVASRMIVGFHLALEGPSWATARVALYKTFAPKVELCARYGIHIADADWPCHHFASHFRVDNGEMRASKPWGLTRGLRVSIELAPRFRPDYKSIVESRFRIANLHAVHWIPGAVRKRERERGDRDYRLDACLTLDEITQIIIRTILFHNMHREYPDALTQEMIADGVPPIPIEMWNWGMKNAHGSPQSQHPEQVRAHLLPASRATVRADGIAWKTLLYTCHTEREENWRALARNNRSWKIDIRYDPGSTDHIWILHGNLGTDARFERCDLISPDHRFAGRRIDEVIDFLTMATMEAAERGRIHIGSEIEEDRLLDRLVHNAQHKRKVAIEGMSPAELVAGIKEKRDVERVLRLLLGSRDLGQANIPADDSRNTELDEFEQDMREEMWGLLTDLDEEEDDDVVAT